MAGRGRPHDHTQAHAQHPRPATQAGTGVIVVDAPMVGIYVGDQSTSTPDYAALWRARQRSYGPVPLWRCYDSSIKTPTTARFTRIPGAVPVYSIKPPNDDHGGFAAGTYSTQYKAVVEALPSDALVTVWHEPEDDLTGPEFLALTERAITDLREVNPDVGYFYCAMAYQWETNSQGHTGSVAGWIEAAQMVDLVTVDVYASQSDFSPMEADVGFRTWMERIVVPSEVPWGVTERGISSHAGEAARTDMLIQDWQYAARHDAHLMMYYDADWTGGAWQLRTPMEVSAMRAIASQGAAR